MSQGPTPRQIAAFWRWFARHHADLGDKFQNEKLLGELDERIRALGPLAWEVGPGKSADFALTLSPGGDLGRLDITMSIVAAAPALPRWELNWAKPPKEILAPIYQILDEDGVPRTIDARGWRYLMYEYPDGLRQVVIEAPELRTHSRWFQELAAEVVLDGYLGEERRMRAFHQIEVVARLDEDAGPHARGIAEVARHAPRLPDRKH